MLLTRFSVRNWHSLATRQHKKLIIIGKVFYCVGWRFAYPTYTYTSRLFRFTYYPKNVYSTLIPCFKRYSTAALVWGLNAFQRPIALLLSGWRTCTLLAVETGAVFK